MSLILHPKVKPHHLARRAVAYVRQSSPGQLRNNTESQRLQYSLVNRAKVLGWDAMNFVDIDLGKSATIGAPEREGFKDLIAQIALGEIGIVLSIMACRLSRTDKDWCQLLEVCQVFDALIADEEQVYDLSLTDDQLMLGIRATLTVVEIKILYRRMFDAKMSKAERGELRHNLPTGYIYDQAGIVQKTPNLCIQEALLLVFSKFREHWSIRKTQIWLIEHNMELPVLTNDQHTVVWKAPSQTFIGGLIKNPFYAGAYCYGRRAIETVLRDGKLIKRLSSLRAPEEYPVLIKNHHEGYIDWATFEENREMVQRNTWTAGEKTQSVRSGQNLLVGMLRCGHCGRKLHVRYWGRSGTIARYLCGGNYAAGGTYCISFAGKKADERFVQELLSVLSPLGIEASLSALDHLAEKQAAERSLLQKKVEQYVYDAQRAQQQYDVVDPLNRLVAFELERRWNDRLEALELTRAELRSFDDSTAKISELDQEKVRDLGQRFQDVWHDNSCSNELRKKIVHTVVEEVIVTLDKSKDILCFIIHWKGGDHTSFEIDKSRQKRVSVKPTSILEILEKMAPYYGDGQIASTLSKHGHKTDCGSSWNASLVQSFRMRYHIEGGKTNRLEPGILSLAEAARYLNVPPHIIRALRSRGLLSMRQVVPYAPWEIRQADLDSEPIRKALEHYKKYRNLRNYKPGELLPQGGSETMQETFLQ